MSTENFEDLYNSDGIKKHSWEPNSYMIGGAYSLNAVAIILSQYIIQIKSRYEEGDINEPDEHLLYTMARWINLQGYHPKFKPLDEPIIAVRALFPLDEYEIIMIRWSPYDETHEIPRKF